MAQCSLQFMLLKLSCHVPSTLQRLDSVVVEGPLFVKMFEQLVGSHEKLVQENITLAQQFMDGYLNLTAAQMHSSLRHTAQEQQHGTGNTHNAQRKTQSSACRLGLEPQAGLAAQHLD
jgi:hypothetical protein